jgi:hypothetical protein
MASALYDKGREAFLTKLIDVLTDNIKVVLVDTALYTVNLATDQFLSDVPALARVATSGNLAGKTATAGVFDASDLAIVSVPGTSVEALVIYMDSGVAGTSRLIAYIDTGNGLPFLVTNGTVNILWDGGANKIFKL